MIYSRRSCNPQQVILSKPRISPERTVERDVEVPNREDEQERKQEYDLDIPIALRKGVRSCTKHPISNFMGYSKLSPQFSSFTISIDDVVIPREIYHALQEQKWKAAIMEEMQALEENDTWEIVRLSYQKNPLGIK